MIKAENISLSSEFAVECENAIIEISKYIINILIRIVYVIKKKLDSCPIYN